MPNLALTGCPDHRCPPRTLPQTAAPAAARCPPLSWRQLGSLQALGHTGYGRLLLAKVAMFLLLIAVAGRSRVLVRRKLTAGALVGAAAPHQHAGGAAHPPLSNDTDARSLWLLRRLVLAEVSIAVVVLAATALLGIATPPRAA
jgi:copper transport protein